MLHLNPHVSIICLQEAPVKPEDIQIFVNACLQYPSLHQFSSSLLDENVYTAWGLISLIDDTRYQYQVETVPQASDQLKDRIQRLVLKGNHTRTLTNLHLPYDAKNQPKLMARFVLKLMSSRSTSFTLAGDFNLSFTEKAVLAIMKKIGHVFAPVANSTECNLENGGSNTLESVDAIITSNRSSAPAPVNLHQTTLLRFTRAHRTIREEGKSQSVLRP